MNQNVNYLNAQVNLLAKTSAKTDVNCKYDAGCSWLQNDLYFVHLLSVDCEINYKQIQLTSRL